MNRRRFIAISAAALLANSGHATAPMRWHGRAMGAEVSLELQGGTQADLDAAIAEIRAMEALFSIYDATSDLSRLNQQGGGGLAAPMAELLNHCDHLHRITHGLFDPTIQPIFRAILQNRTPPWHLVDWNRVTLTGTSLRLAPGQQLTLNGIAQGYATDSVRALLRARGFTQALVSVGEHAAIGGPYRLSLQDPKFGDIGTRSVENRAIATSSAAALRFANATHILHPKGAEVPQWSTVSVEGNSATLADGLSTAFSLAPKTLIEQIVAQTDIRVTLVDMTGDLTTLG